MSYAKSKSRISAIVRETERLGGEIVRCDDAVGAGFSAYLIAQFPMGDDYFRVSVRVSDHAPSQRDVLGFRHDRCDMYASIGDAIPAILSEFRFAVCATKAREVVALAKIGTIQ